MSVLAYRDVLAMVADGALVSIVAGTYGGQPVIVCLPIMLPAGSRSERNAYDASRRVRAGQMVGIAGALGEHLAAHGFTPA